MPDLHDMVEAIREAGGAPSNVSKITWDETPDDRRIRALKMMPDGSWVETHYRDLRPGDIFSPTLSGGWMHPFRYDATEERWYCKAVGEPHRSMRHGEGWRVIVDCATWLGGVMDDPANDPAPGTVN